MLNGTMQQQEYRVYERHGVLNPIISCVLETCQRADRLQCRHTALGETTIDHRSSFTSSLFRSILHSFSSTFKVDCISLRLSVFVLALAPTGKRATRRRLTSRNFSCNRSSHFSLAGPSPSPLDDQGGIKYFSSSSAGPAFPAVAGAMYSMTEEGTAYTLGTGVALLAAGAGATYSTTGAFAAYTAGAGQMYLRQELVRQNTASASAE